MAKIIETYNTTFNDYLQVEFDDFNMAEEYIRKYLNDYNTGITLAFGGIQLFRRIPFPYTRYGVTNTGIVFKWRGLFVNDTYKVLPTTYMKETENGPIAYVSIITDYNTREFIERAKLVLYAFHQHQQPTDKVFHIDGNTENDNIYNLKWIT